MYHVNTIVLRFAEISGTCLYTLGTVSRVHIRVLRFTEVYSPSEGPYNIIYTFVSTHYIKVHCMVLILEY